MKNVTPTFVVAAMIAFSLSPVFAQSLAPVVMPEADLMVQLKLDKIQKSPIYLALQAIQKEKQEALSASPLSGLDDTGEFMTSIATATGLEATDFQSLILVADLDGISAEGKPDMTQFNGVGAIRLGKELPIGKLEAGVKALLAQEAEKKGGSARALSRATHGGTAILRVEGTSADEIPLHIAVTGGDRILVFGSKNAIGGALDRFSSGKTISPASILPASIGRAVGGSTSYVIVRPTAEMLAGVTKQGETGAPNPAAAFGQKLKALGLGINFGETMAVKLVGDYGTAEAAKQISTLLDAQVVSGIKMTVSMMTGGKPLPVLQTMRTGSTEAGTAWLQLSLSKADLDQIAEIIEAQLKAAIPGAGTMPAAPMEMPQ